MSEVRVQPNVTPFLWYNDGAEAAVNHYTRLFEDSEVFEISRWGQGGPVEAGTAMSIRFRLGSLELIAFNGGPAFMMDSSFSLMVQCEDQAAIDYYWEGLLAVGGTPQACGWLKDAYGLSWQVISPRLMQYLSSPDAERSARVMDVMLGMQKLELAPLQAAWEG